MPSAYSAYSLDSVAPAELIEAQCAYVCTLEVTKKQGLQMHNSFVQTIVLEKVIKKEICIIPLIRNTLYFHLRVPYRSIMYV